ncbi:MAG: hypothetical protein AAF696_32435, partial [Bacteroidota bacterium]
MKILLISCLLILFNTLAFSQDRLNLESPELGERVFKQTFYPVVKGKILNYDPAVNQDIFIKYVMVQPIPGAQETKIAELKEDGSFELTFDNGLPYQQIWFFIGDRFYCEILANKDLWIEADLNLLPKKKLYWYGKGIKFSGTDAAHNIYINEYIRFRQLSDKGLSKKKREILRGQEVSLEEKINGLEIIDKRYKEIQQKYAKKAGDKYLWILENESTSDYFADLCKLFRQKEEAGIAPAIKEKVLNHQAFFLSNNSFDYYRSLPKILGVKNRADLVEKTKNLSPGKSAVIKLINQPSDIDIRLKYLEQITPGISGHWAKEWMEQRLFADKEHIRKIEAN